MNNLLQMNLKQKKQHNIVIIYWNTK